jgi:hypothetical protein
MEQPVRDAAERKVRQVGAPARAQDHDPGAMLIRRFQDGPGGIHGQQDDLAYSFSRWVLS